jgi:nucleoid DNA-binding protein
MAKKTTRYNLVAEIHESLLKTLQVTKNGTVKLARKDVKDLIENAFTTASKRAAKGERVRFPVVGALVRKEVAARKGGKGVNPFTKEAITLKARPASKKPRWSFPKKLRETFAEKRNW